MLDKSIYGALPNSEDSVPTVDRARSREVGHVGQPLESSTSPPPSLRRRLSGVLAAGRFRRRFLVCLGLGLIPPVLAWAAFASGHRVVGARLNLPSKPLHLGSGKPGQILEGTFLLSNRGDSPCDFRLNASCGCSELSPRAGTILPGEDTTVHIGVRLEKAGIDKTIIVTIESNDAVNKNASYHVMVNCPSPLELAPSAIQFGSVAPGTSREETVRIHALDRGTVFQATVDSPFVEISRSRTSDLDEVLRVRLLDSAPQGPLVATVVLRTDNDIEIRLPIMADVVEPLVAAPSTAILRRAPDGGIVPINIVVARLDGKPIGKLLKADLPAGLTLREVVASAGTRRFYRLESDATAELHDATILLTYDGPLTTAIRVVVRRD